MERTTTLAPQHEGSFIYVGEQLRTELLKDILMSNKRDFDVLGESPGTFETIS